MSTPILLTMVLGFCSCTSVVRATKIQLVDANGATIAELGRNDGKTSLSFYEYPAGVKCTTLEMTSHEVPNYSEDVSSLKALGYGGDELPMAIANVTLAAMNGIRAEISSDGVTYYGKDGSVLWVILVSKRTDGVSMMEFFDGDGKALFSTASLK